MDTPVRWVRNLEKSLAQEPLLPLYLCRSQGRQAQGAAVVDGDQKRLRLRV